MISLNPQFSGNLSAPNKNKSQKGQSFKGEMHCGSCGDPSKTGPHLTNKSRKLCIIA